MKQSSTSRTYTDAETTALIDATFCHYRSTGFPYYNLSPSEKEAKLQQLISYSHTSIMKESIIKQTMHGLSLAWSYHSHSWEVRCGTMMTPMQVFESDTHLRKAIRRRITYGGTVTDASMRKGLRSVSGAQGVSNFRPTAAAAIYHSYLPEQGGAVWDMSAGYGGRLLGAIACNRVTRYIGTDPCSQTMNGLRKMADELGRGGLNVELHQVGSEDFIPESESLDLCFTSPPYWNTEQYSDEPTQSYLRYPERQQWLHGFLGKTLDNCWRGLKSSGKLIINIANVKTYPTLQANFLQLAISMGWKLETRLFLALSRMMGTRRDKQEKFKYEPVFVFSKQ